jgi:hypothetical protein
MPNEGSRALRRIAAVLVAGGILAVPATPALAAPVGFHDGGSVSPDGTRVTVVHPNPWDSHGVGRASAAGVAPTGTRVTVGDGHGWIESDPDGHPWAG